MLAVVTILEKNVISERIKEILAYVKINPLILHKLHFDSKYKDLTKNHLTFS